MIGGTLWRDTMQNHQCFLFEISREEKGDWLGTKQNGINRVVGFPEKLEAM